MSDETTSETTTTETPPSGGDSPASYSQAQVEELIARAKGDAWAAARAEFRNKATDRSSGKRPDSNRNDKGDTKADPDRLVRILRQRDALDDVLAGRTVTADQRRMLRDLMEKADPDEPDAWAKSFVDSFIASGSPKPSNDNNANGGAKPPTTETMTGAKPPQSDAGAPQALPVWERPSNPFEWTAEDLARLEAQKGKREAMRLIRRKAEEFARTMKIQVSGPQRR